MWASVNQPTLSLAPFSHHAAHNLACLSYLSCPRCCRCFVAHRCEVLRIVAFLVAFLWQGPFHSFQNHAESVSFAIHSLSKSADVCAAPTKEIYTVRCVALLLLSGEVLFILRFRGDVIFNWKDYHIPSYYLFSQKIQAKKKRAPGTLLVGAPKQTLIFSTQSKFRFYTIFQDENRPLCAFSVVADSTIGCGAAPW